MRLVSSICLPISGSSWYCLSLSESRKQRVRALTWLAFSWSTDRASIACKLVFMKLGDFLSTQRVDYWQLFLIAFLGRSCYFMIVTAVIKFIVWSDHHYSSRHSTIHGGGKVVSEIEILHEKGICWLDSMADVVKNFHSSFFETWICRTFLTETETIQYIWYFGRYKGQIFKYFTFCEKVYLQKDTSKVHPS